MSSKYNIEDINLMLNKLKSNTKAEGHESVELLSWCISVYEERTDLSATFSTSDVGNISTGFVL